MVFEFQNEFISKPTPSPTPEVTNTPSPTATATPEITNTPAPTPTATPVATETPSPSQVPEPSPTPVPMITLYLNKIWDDEGAIDSRPDHIYVELFANDVFIQTFKLTTEEDWEISTNIRQYNDDGQEIHYSWKEAEIMGYKLEEIQTNGLTTTLINKPYSPPVVPEEQKQPRIPRNRMTTLNIDEYDTALGLEGIINHVGDCFD